MMVLFEFGKGDMYSFSISYLSLTFFLLRVFASPRHCVCWIASFLQGWHVLSTPPARQH